jgi:hypothetical protein
MSVLTLTPANINAFVAYVYMSRQLEKMTCILPNGKVIAITKDDEKVSDEKGLRYTPRTKVDASWHFEFSCQGNEEDLYKFLIDGEMDPMEAKKMVSQIKNATHVYFSSMFNKIVNKSGCNRDVRGMLVKELKLPYTRIVDVPSYGTILTIDEAAELFWTVKSHHFEHWYELTSSCGAMVEQNIGSTKYNIVICPDHGS